MTGSVIIKGENRVGQTLTTELNVDVDGYTCDYQWYSNDTDNTTNGSAIVGAISENFMITDDLVNKYIYVEVIVSLPNYKDITVKDITDTDNNEFAQVQEAHTPILKAETEADAYTNKYIFGNSSISQRRSDIIKITLQNTQAIPTGEVSATWDVSKEQNKSVTAWLVNESTGFHLYIGGTGKVIASNAEYLFANYPNCTEINGLDKLDTTNITSMNSMFKDCGKVKELDLSSFNTSNVENMKGMFENCGEMTELNIQEFNTRKVTDISRMFYGCSKLTSLDVTRFNTSKVEDMSYAFYGCKALTKLDVSTLITSNVLNMSNMFNGCSGITALELRNFKTSKVTNMSGMFEGCSGLKGLDLKSFNTTAVTQSDAMFKDSSSLKTMLLGENFGKLTGTNMFGGCSSLVAIIAQKETAIELGANTGLDSLANAKIYVANEAIASNYSTVFGAEKVKVIMEILGDNPTRVDAGEVYIDAGVKIIDASKEYIQYGYILDVSGLPIDTTVPGEYQVVYKLKYGEVQK